MLGMVLNLLVGLTDGCKFVRLVVASINSREESRPPG